MDGSEGCAKPESIITYAYDTVRDMDEGKG
jgi:hypothetical protein